jgi:hypothetical protein
MRELFNLLLLVMWLIGVVVGFGIHWIVGLVAIFLPPIGVILGLVGAFL